MKVTLFCHSHPELHLGPSVPSDINFRQGFAVVDTDKLPDFEKWINYGGNPYGIENLGKNSEGLVPAESTEFVCQVCADQGTEKGFATKFALTGHMRKHAPKEA